MLLIHCATLVASSCYTEPDVNAGLFNGSLSDNQAVGSSQLCDVGALSARRCLMGPLSTGGV